MLSKTDMNPHPSLSTFSGEISKKTEVLVFLVHLRLHYQFFILSGPYLLGGVFGKGVSLSFLLHFFTVHILLFGGVTAYNSYWDKDEGPIGGLKHPPRMTPWMLPASWAMQVGGALLALTQGALFAACYGAAMLLFWLYSSPLMRFKGKPFPSLFAIGIGTGFFPLIMGYLAATGEKNIPHLTLPILAGLGATLLLVSLYPLSQVYQINEDTQRGDATFASRYGLPGVRRVFALCFSIGTLLTACALYVEAGLWGPLLGLSSALAGILIYWRLRALRGVPDEYSRVMNIKYAASLLFVVFLGSLLLVLGLKA